MWYRRALALCLFVIIVAGGSVQAASGDTPKRVALVIGNSAYTDKPLANPVNDAVDMAAALEKAGFQVLLRKDVNLAGMEDALVAFSRALAGKTEALFYFAGHGVQVNGENYLLPVREEIRTEATVRSRGVSLGQVLETLKSSGVKTGILLLDACRDNPFPGASRSGTRGLSLVAAPKELETLIAYATEPGDTAADGEGRNGVFTASLLRNLPVPGISITDAMIKVRAEVKAETGDRQRPRTDNGLSRQFYIIDASLKIKEQESLLAMASVELDQVNRVLEETRKKIAATKSSSEKEKLELEQRRQLALQKAKEQERTDLLIEAERLKEIQNRAKELAQQEASITTASMQRQKKLAEEAERKRKELTDAQSKDLNNDPEFLVNRVEEARRAIRDLEAQTLLSWSSIERDVNKFWDAKLALLDTKPGKIETDQEFSTRISQEKQDIDSGRAADLRNRKSRLEQTLSRDIDDMRTDFELRIKALESPRWIKWGNSITLEVKDYNRNQRSQAFVLSCRDPSFPWLGTVTKDFSKAANLLAEVESVEVSARAQGLVGELTWRITYDRKNERYVKILESSAVRDIISGSIVASSANIQTIGWFTPGNLNAPIKGLLKIVASANKSGKVFINGRQAGMLPYESSMAPGAYSIEVQWEGEPERWSGQANLEQNQSLTITALPPSRYSPPAETVLPSKDFELGNGSLFGTYFYWAGIMESESGTLSSGGGFGIESIMEGVYFSLNFDIFPLEEVSYLFSTSVDLGLALHGDDFALSLLPSVGLIFGKVDQNLPAGYNSSVGYSSPAYSSAYDSMAGAWFLGVETGIKLRVGLDDETFMSFGARYRFIDDITEWHDSDDTKLNAQYLTVPTFAIPPLMFEVLLGFQVVE